MSRKFNKRTNSSRKSLGGRRRGGRKGAHQRFKNSIPNGNRFRRSVVNYQPSHVTSGRGVGFPDSFDVTLCYSNDLQLTSSVGEQQMIYEGNNPWDPDPQLGGRSADQYDVFRQVYRYCRVYASHIEVNYNIINGSGFQCCVAPLAENPSISYEMLMCLPRAKTGRVVNVSGITSSKLVNGASSSAMYGFNNLDWDISNTFSLINPDLSTSVIEPTRKWYWHVAFQNNASQSDLNGACKVRIFYKCHFYGRKFNSTLQAVTDDGDTEIPVLVESQSPTLIQDPVV